MKTFSMLSLTIGAALTITSCGNDASSNGRSTNIDSTNQQGTAPVEYTAGTPTQTTDTHQIGASRAAEYNSRQEVSNTNDRANGTGTNTSNTTDQRTTSGSANAGDADKDIKR